MPKHAISVYTQLWLYSVVFTSRSLRVVVAFVVFVLLLQMPLSGYAQSIATTSTTGIPEEGSEEAEIDTDSTVVEESGPVREPVAGNNDSFTETPVTMEPSEEIASSSTVTETSASSSPTNDSVSEPASVDTPSSTSTESLSVPVASSSSRASSTMSDNNSDSAVDSVNTTSTTSTVAGATSATYYASSSNQAVEPKPVTSVVYSDANAHQFAADECIAVADGSYYCGQQTSAPPSTKDQLYVALDADGDRELFLQRAGATEQITHNQHDDAAPYYDPVSDTIVWHAQISGRYQIFSFDVTDGTITQITDTTTNSMEPTRHGDTIAWQEWGATGWDIVVLHDGNRTQVTDDSLPDLAPVVYETYVLWQQPSDRGQQLMLYDLETEAITAVQAHAEPVQVASARMMLVYEGLTASGDRVVRGIDPLTGAISPITTAPAPLPDELPSSEPTSEPRALVTAKPQTEEEEVTAASSSGTSTDSVASSTQATTATSSDELTLAIPPVPDSSTTTNPTSVASTTVATSSFDLVIPPVASSTDS